MSEKWQMTMLVNPPEGCLTCKERPCKDIDACHQIDYDHEGYPYMERFLKFEPVKT